MDAAFAIAPIFVHSSANLGSMGKLFAFGLVEKSRGHQEVVSPVSAFHTRSRDASISISSSTWMSFFGRRRRHIPSP